MQTYLRLSVLIAALALPGLAQSRSVPVDSDHDGLSDELEQSLLQRFRPTFMTSAHDCATRPARFQPGNIVPVVAATDGTIYGQVFPVSQDRVEIHYYTLWDRDCGRLSHPLDAEHVAALVALGEEPSALYWYAGAHERTVCDISSGARSSALSAQVHGPRVWSAAGKHALYFTAAMCKHGCGADSCDDDVELAQEGPVINLGERNAPANGSLWVASPQWLLSGKMETNFPADVRARLDALPADTVETLHGRSVIRGTIQGSDTVFNGAATGAHHTTSALDKANDETARSLGKARKATGNFLTRAWKAVFQSKPKDK